VIGLVAVAAACGIYGQDDLLPGKALIDAGVHDAAPIVTPPDSAQVDGDTCAHVRWPARPVADDPSATPDVIATSAIATLNLGLANEAGPASLLGFDLDHVCTCPGPDSCVNSISAGPHCDEDGGRDNAAQPLLQLVGTLPGLNEAALNQALHSGKYGLVIVVSEWNGQPNDTQVKISLFISNGLITDDGGSTGPVKGDGTDVWTVSSGSLLGGAALAGTDCGDQNTACSPVYYDDNAYVTGGTMVGSVDFSIALGGGGSGTVNVDLSGSVVLATVTASAGGWSLTNGTIAGRWATSKLLSSLAAVNDPLNTGTYLCGSDATYALVKNDICNAMDIAADPNLDQTGAPCDAISISLGFTADPAQMGLVTSHSDPFTGCTSDAGVPFHDQCE
jgi:hypothetical protein